VLSGAVRFSPLRDEIFGVLKFAGCVPPPKFDPLTCCAVEVHAPPTTALIFNYGANRRLGNHRVAAQAVQRVARKKFIRRRRAARIRYVYWIAESV
jgi:hypothetical protein